MPYGIQREQLFEKSFEFKLKGIYLKNQEFQQAKN